MTKLKSIAIAVVLSGAGGVAAPALAADGMMAPPGDQAMMQSCMSMSYESMMKNSGCAAAMKAMKIPDADMKMVMGCKAMAPDAMAKAPSCTPMMTKYPDMMKIPMKPAMPMSGGMMPMPAAPTSPGNGGAMAPTGM